MKVILKKIKYSNLIELNLSSIKPCVSGPKRPQDKINLENVKKPISIH